MNHEPATVKTSSPLAFDPDSEVFDSPPVRSTEDKAQEAAFQARKGSLLDVDNGLEEYCDELELDSSYWVAADMASLNGESEAAISRLRAFKPPEFTLWNRIPITRRAAVLVLLYADRRGDLRVVLTIRSNKMRSFSGHAAFPGGKADTLEETPYEVARREAWEEIGLPDDDSKIPPPFRIELLCYLPHNLARNDLVVRPCVALLKTTLPLGSEPSPLVEETMLPRLHTQEVAAVFTAPFRDFLRSTDRDPPPGGGALPPGHWYDGSWIKWRDEPWRVHNFYVPVNNQWVARPEVEDELQNAEGKMERREGGVEADESSNSSSIINSRYKVWGMTAKILVDTAIIAYGKRPEMEHNEVAGDEKLILMAAEDGRFFDKSKA